MREKRHWKLFETIAPRFAALRCATSADELIHQKIKNYPRPRRSRGWERTRRNFASYVQRKVQSRLRRPYATYRSGAGNFRAPSLPLTNTGVAVNCGVVEFQWLRVTQVTRTLQEFRSLIISPSSMKRRALSRPIGPRWQRWRRRCEEITLRNSHGNVFSPRLSQRFHSSSKVAAVKEGILISLERSSPQH